MHATTMNRHLLGLAAAMLIALPAVAGQTIYRWVDAQGNAVHSDRPPPQGVEYETFNLQRNLMEQVDPATAESDTPVPVTGAAPASATAAAPQPTVQKDPEICERARKNLETLNGLARVRVANAEGEIHYLSEEEKAAQRAAAEQAISVNCD